MREFMIITLAAASTIFTVPSIETSQVETSAPLGIVRPAVNQCDEVGPLEVSEDPVNIFSGKAEADAFAQFDQLELPPQWDSKLQPTAPQCQNGTCPDGYSCENGFCRKRKTPSTDVGGSQNGSPGRERSIVTKRSQCQSEPKRQGFFARLRQGTHCRKTCRRR